MRAQVEYSGCREAQTQDGTFLLRLFRESQQGLIAMLGTAAEPLIEMQYRGRMMTYGAQYPEAVDSILLGEDGTPAGRLLVDRKPDCWRVVDIAVLAAHRGRGLGTRALSECQRQAAAVGAGMGLQVTPENPARRLYERLGFRVVDKDRVAVEMVWAAPKDLQESSD